MCGCKRFVCCHVLRRSIYSPLGAHGRNHQLGRGAFVCLFVLVSSLTFSQIAIFLCSSCQYVHVIFHENACIFPHRSVRLIVRSNMTMRPQGDTLALQRYVCVFVCMYVCMYVCMHTLCVDLLTTCFHTQALSEGVEVTRAGIHTVQTDVAVCMHTCIHFSLL